jgi:hypothetical protein
MVRLKGRHYVIGGLVLLLGYAAYKKYYKKQLLIPSLGF